MGGMNSIGPGPILGLCVLLAISWGMPSAEATSVPVVKIIGGPESVFVYERQKCDEVDIPDAPLRAFRGTDGTVTAFATHYVNRRLYGLSLANLNHECDVVYQGGHNPDPAAFDDRTWIAATWTDDGHDVSALGHNEYQADKFDKKCRYSTYRECWYNSIVLLHSLDGGKNFFRSDTNKADPVISPPFANEIDQGHPRGYFNPTNIISGRDGYKYTLIGKGGFDAPRIGRCLFRARNPDEIDSWQFFDGVKFVESSGSPYDFNSKQLSLCQPVNGLSGWVGSIAAIRGTNLYAAFLAVDKGKGSIDVQFSDDLINWGNEQEILPVSLFWSKDCVGGHRYSYPSVLDDDSPGRNFDSIGAGQNVYLFLMQTGCDADMKRNLVRFSLHFENFH